jgi:DNA-binding IclR family transcriptional regulator
VIESTNRRPGHVVQTLERAVVVLNEMAGAGGPLSVQTLAQRTGLNRTVTHRLVHTLLDHGLAARVDGRFTTGPQLLGLGFSHLQQLPFRRVALPYLISLHAQALQQRPWTASLTLAVGAETVLIDRVWNPAAPLDALQDLGTRYRITDSASGRAILAGFPDAKLATVLGAPPTQALASTVARVRAQAGASFARSEKQPGVSAVAAALRDGSGPVGAIVVAGPQLEDHLRVDTPIVQAVLRTARRISDQLGA